MLKRLQSSTEIVPALFALALLSCSGGTDGPGDGGAMGSPSNGIDAPILDDAAVVVVQTDAAPVPSPDATNCLPFSPPIACAPGTACPGDAYCDLQQTPPVCTKLHCLPDGAACPADGTSGNAYCTSGICLAGVCTSPAREGSSCATVPCAAGFQCLGYPPTCMKLQPTGEACRDDTWCATGTTKQMHCLSGVCGVSYCGATGTHSSCVPPGFCDPGYDCLKYDYVCVQLYCGKDGIPCSSDVHCATGYGCVDGHCRQLNVAPHCAGTPSNAVCPLSDVAYSVVPGCTFTVPSCSGTAFACALHNGLPQDCTDQVGCQWDSSTNKCTGTPTPCSQLTGTVGLKACVPLNGCLGTVAATGSPTPCSQLSTSDCASQPGCKVTDVGIY